MGRFVTYELIQQSQNSVKDFEKTLEYTHCRDYSDTDTNVVRDIQERRLCHEKD